MDSEKQKAERLLKTLVNNELSALLSRKEVNELRLGECINKKDTSSYIRINKNERDGNDFFFPMPAEYILLNLYFITITYNSREMYLILDYSGYVDPINLENNRTSIWSVPYTNFSVKDETAAGIDRPTRYGEICQMYDDYCNVHKAEISAAEAQLRCDLGISHWSIEDGDTYLEYKTSVTSNVKKCYCVKEHFVKDVEMIGLLNLADPDGLFGHQYFPLHEAGKSWHTENGRILYKNRYIPENVACRIQVPESLSRYRILVDDRFKAGKTGDKAESGISNQLKESVQRNNVKIFISHSTKDREYAIALVDLLEGMGVKESQIFCSALRECGVKPQEDIVERIKEEFDNHSHLWVFFILSEDFYRSPIGMNEMGAAWILRCEYMQFCVPGFSESDKKGVINKNDYGIYLGGHDLSSDLNDLKMKISEKMGCDVDLNRWDREREKFIEKIKNVAGIKPC